MRKWIDSSINYFAIIMIVFSLVYLVFPADTLASLGFEGDETGLLFLRVIGSLIATDALFIFILRNAKVNMSKQVVLILLVMMTVGFITVLTYQFFSGVGFLGTIGVFLYGIAVALLAFRYQAIK